MKTDIKVLERIYKLLDIPEIVDKIGGIYLKKRPSLSNNVDIVLNNLPILSGDTQSIVVFINIYCQNFPETGTPDIPVLAEMSGVVIEALTEYMGNYDIHDKTEFLSIEIVSQGIMNDDREKTQAILL